MSEPRVRCSSCRQKSIVQCPQCQKNYFGKKGFVSVLVNFLVEETVIRLLRRGGERETENQSTSAACMYSDRSRFAKLCHLIYLERRTIKSFSKLTFTRSGSDDHRQ